MHVAEKGHGSRERAWKGEAGDVTGAQVRTGGPRREGREEEGPLQETERAAGGRGPLPRASPVVTTVFPGEPVLPGL